MGRMHKPEVDPKTKQKLPLALQDKRSVIPIEAADFDQWLEGTAQQAQLLLKLKLAPVELFDAGPAPPDPPRPPKPRPQRAQPRRRRRQNNPHSSSPEGWCWMTKGPPSTFVRPEGPRSLGVQHRVLPRPCTIFGSTAPGTPLARRQSPSGSCLAPGRSATLRYCSQTLTDSGSAEANTAANSKIACGLHEQGAAAPPQSQPPSVVTSEGRSVWFSQTHPDPAQITQPMGEALDTASCPGARAPCRHGRPRPRPPCATRPP
jgi:hypothetical protein